MGNKPEQFRAGSKRKNLLIAGFAMAPTACLRLEIKSRLRWDRLFDPACRQGRSSEPEVIGILIKEKATLKMAFNQ